MFKISEFSRLSKVSLKTLRYYDQIGLLKPDKVDPDSGYRYYSADQLLELNRILIYKELGFTLPQIIQLRREDITLEHIQGMFKLKQGEIQHIVAQEQAKLARLQERMRLMEREGCVEMEQEIRIAAEEPQSFLFLRACGREEDIPELLQLLDESLTRDFRQLLQSPKVLLWKELDGNQEEFEFEVGYYVTPDHPALLSEGVQARQLPPEPMMATMTFHSSSAFADTACTDLAKWIEQNGYRIKEDEPGREIYYPSSAKQESQLREIKIPITPRSQGESESE